MLAAVTAFVLMEIAERMLPGHRLTLPVIALSIGAATLGKLSYSLERAALRRIRSRRRPDGA
jgi:branched-subunit amino acid ABC-type transport system permease component